ncbi:MAG: YlxM family DNA-binding protein [Clostridium sp.]
MEKIVEQGLLYDFYGELLTEHQRRIYEDMVLNDLSPSEIAKEQGISRQSVHDLKKRCDKILEEYETKLQLVAKFMKIREMIRELDDLQIPVQNQRYGSDRPDPKFPVRLQPHFRRL